MTPTELITAMQDDTKAAKELLARISRHADKLAAADDEAGNKAASADGMIWAGAVRQCHGALIAAHGVASHALLVHYPEAMTRIGGR